MPFNNPILAGEELIRSAIRSEDFITDVSGWRIARDGSAEFNSLSVRDTISAEDVLIQGESVKNKLASIPQGIVAAHLRTTYSIATAAGTERSVMRLNVPIIGGRTYKVTSRMPIFVNSATRGYVEYYLRYTLNGTNPTLSSPLLRHDVIEVPAGGVPISARFEFPFLNAADADLRLLLSYKGLTPAANFQVSAEPTWPAEIEVTDIGLGFPGGGANDDTGTGSAAVFRSFNIQPYASRGYTAAGNALPYNNQYMHQGDIGVDGNRRSWAWFDVNNTGGGNGLGSIADMAGASSVDYIELYLYYPHWYYSSGGNAWIGHHNSAVVTPTEQGGASYKEALDFWPGRNVGKWVNINNAAFRGALLAGAFKGIVLGNTGSASLDDYGYAFGANGVLGQTPGLRAGYWK